VRLDDGTERTADLRVLDGSTIPEWKTAASAIPLYRQRQGEGFWFEWLPESGTVYVNFRKYDDLRAKSRELWSFVDTHPVHKIAIDLRQNGGGDYNVGRNGLQPAARSGGLKPALHRSSAFSHRRWRANEVKSVLKTISAQPRARQHRRYRQSCSRYSRWLRER
jgi:hypothetical protein